MKRLVTAVLFLALAPAMPAPAAAPTYCAVLSPPGYSPWPAGVHVWAVFGRPGADPVVISWAPQGRWTLLGRAQPGRHLDVAESLHPHATARCWGPYAGPPHLYDEAAAHAAALTNYHCLDAFTRGRGRSAVNCIHAVSDLAGSRRLRTGPLYGRLAARRVARHLERNASLSPAPDPAAALAALGLDPEAVILARKEKP